MKGLLSKLYSVLQFGAGAPGSFVNIVSQHVEGGGLITLAQLYWFGHPQFVIPSLVALAAFKEFWFDMRYEQPPQPFGTVTSRGALNDFVGYLLGIAVGTACWLL